MTPDALRTYKRAAMNILHSARRLSASYVDNFLPFLSARKSLAPDDRPEPMDVADQLCQDHDSFSDHGSPVKAAKREPDENAPPKPSARKAPASAKKPVLIASAKKPSAASAKKVVKVKTVTKAKPEPPKKVVIALAKPSATKAKQPAPKAKSAPALPLRVKSEPMRRSSRSIAHKKGFFAERNLERIVWTGTGTALDPVCV